MQDGEWRDIYYVRHVIEFRSLKRCLELGSSLAIKRDVGGKSKHRERPNLRLLKRLYCALSRPHSRLHGDQ